MSLAQKLAIEVPKEVKVNLATMYLMLAQELGYQEGALDASQHIINTMASGDFSMGITTEEWPFGQEPTSTAYIVHESVTDELAKRLLDFYQFKGIDAGLIEGYSAGYDQGVMALIDYFDGQSTSV
jgi:hypothetical protein